MPWETWILLVPSPAAARELPRRIAASGRALAGVYAVTVRELARRVAEPALLGRGLQPWHAGHGALVARRLLSSSAAAGLTMPPDAPASILSVALARTLSALRLAGAPAEALTRVAPAEGDDARRVRALEKIYAGYVAEVESRFADPAGVLRAATAALPQARWLQDAQVLVVDALELEPVEADFVQALARLRPLRIVRRARPAAWRAPLGGPEVDARETLLAPVAGETTQASLARLRTSLFEPAGGGPAEDGAVEIVTGAGEAAEARAVVRRLLREIARGVPLEEIGLLLPRPEPYGTLFSDLLTHAGIPWRLHPSLPLRLGRASRALLLLLRCRGLPRAAVMEFLGFAPIPFAELLGEGADPWPAQWDLLSREAGVVQGLERWMIGLRSYAETARETAASSDAARARRLSHRATEAEALLRVVELLGATLDMLSGEASWPEWSARLQAALHQWIGPAKDREALLEVILDLGALGAVAGRDRVGAAEMEEMLQARLDWERQPLDPVESGAVHVGAFDALAGVPFRVVAIPGLVEGGYPGVLRPDPFLLDAEREALARPATAAVVPRGPRRQLSLFDPEPAAPTPSSPPVVLPTSQERLVQARREFHRAVSQATERLVLAYPRADPRTGRERLPSLFLVAAASTVAGRALSMPEMLARTREDALETLPLDDAVDAGERDLARVRRGGARAIEAVARGSAFFRRALAADAGRWSGELTAFDGVLDELPHALRPRLDPLARVMSASGLESFANCGFRYLLERVLRLDVIDEPQERRGLDPLETGQLFHAVAEKFLGERKEEGRLPLRGTEEERERVHALAHAEVAALVQTRPPRYQLEWEMVMGSFLDLLDGWLRREVLQADKRTPLAFEVPFGLEEPVTIDLGEGRVLRVTGRIDRIDQRADGALIVRDYKTGKVPLPHEDALFRGGRQLQMPVYVIATRHLYPGRPVGEALLDYVRTGTARPFDPTLADGGQLRELLGGMATRMAAGVFLQDPNACTWCDFVGVCGPKPLLELRRLYKSRARRARGIA